MERRHRPFGKSKEIDRLEGFPPGPSASAASSRVMPGGVTSPLVNTTLGSSESPAAELSRGCTGGHFIRGHGVVV